MTGETTTWRQRIAEQMSRRGESWADVVGCSNDGAALDAHWAHGAGELTWAGPDLFVWTSRHVYAAVEIEGFGEVLVVPRHPGPEALADWAPPIGEQSEGREPWRSSRWRLGSTSGTLGPLDVDASAEHGPLACAVCPDGHYRPGTKPRVVERDGRLAVVTGVPIQMCDRCADTLLDAAVMTRLDQLSDDALLDNQMSVRSYIPDLTPDVTGVRVLHEHLLEVTFADGTVGEYDFAGKLRGPAFTPLRDDYQLFRSVSVRAGTIAWPVGDDPNQWPDWAPEELYKHIVGTNADAGYRNAVAGRHRDLAVRQASAGRPTSRVGSQPAEVSLERPVPHLAANITWVRVNGGRAFSNIAHWDEDHEPVPGERVLVGDGGPLLEAVIAEVRPDGVIVLSLPQFLPTFEADLNNEDDDGHGWALVPMEEFRPQHVYPGARVLAGRHPEARAAVTVLRTELLGTASTDSKVLVTFNKDY